MVKLKDKCADNVIALDDTNNLNLGSDHLYYIGNSVSTDYRPVITKT
jgi:hypothetical protein